MGVGVLRELSCFTGLEGFYTFLKGFLKVLLRVV